MKKGDEVICISEDGFFYTPYPRVGDIIKVLNTRTYRQKLFLKLDGYNYDMPAPYIVKGGRGFTKVGFLAENFMNLSKYCNAFRTN